MTDRHAAELRSDYCLMLLGCCRSWESLAQMIKNPTLLFWLAFVLKWGQLNSWAGHSSQLPEGLIIQLCLKVNTNISAEATAWFVKILFLLKDVCFHLQLIAELICFSTPFVSLMPVLHINSLHLYPPAWKEIWKKRGRPLQWSSAASITRKEKVDPRHEIKKPRPFVCPGR